MEYRVKFNRLEGTSSKDSLSTEISLGAEIDGVIEVTVYYGLIGGAGADTLTSKLSAQISALEAGAAGAVRDALKSSGYQAHFWGEDGNDTLIGDDLAETLNGSYGNDTYSAGGGDDAIADDGGRNVFDGGAGFDTLYLSGDQTGSTYENVEALVTSWVRMEIASLNKFEFIGFDLGTTTYIDLMTAGTLTSKFDADRPIEFTPANGDTTVDVGYSVADIKVNGWYADSGHKRFTTGSGNDDFRALIGEWTIDSGDGDDSFQSSSRQVSGILDGGSGFDTLTLNGDASDLKVTGIEELTVGANTVFASPELFRQFKTIGINQNAVEVKIGLSTPGSVSIALRDNVKGVFVGSGGNDVISLTYSGTNSWSADGANGNDYIYGGMRTDVLSGGDGNDVLHGGAGGDKLIGGLGSDTASYIKSTGSVTANLLKPGSNSGEAGGDSYSSIENLTGSAFGDTLVGNSSANVIKGGDGGDIIDGGSGADRLYGNLGADVLTGGLGSDRFIFDSKIGGGNVDKITDFNALDDTILLDKDFIAAGVVGHLSQAAFYIGAKAHDGDDRIIYNKTTGALYYDPDGNKAGLAVQIATLSKGLALTASDFEIIV